MELNIEISLDLITCKNVFTTIHSINNIIHNNNAIYNYSFYETEGSRNIERNEYINIVTFDSKSNLLNFLKDIKILKNIRIDCIYYSNNIKYLYISKRYSKINNISNIEYISNNQYNILKLVENTVN